MSPKATSMNNKRKSWTCGQDVIWIVRHHGLIGTLRRLKRSLPYHLWLHLTLAGRRERDFDRIHGIDTEGIVPRWKFGNVGPNLFHAVQYAPTKPYKFYELIDSLPIDYSQFTFIDIGSGKGRALLLAQKYRFRYIIGVEFSSILCEIARRNLNSIAEIICTDATQYIFPLEPLVIYMCNPFDAELMKQIVENLKLSLLECPRPIYIVYWNAVHLNAFSSFEFVSGRDNEFAIFKYSLLS